MNDYRPIWLYGWLGVNKEGELSLTSRPLNEPELYKLATQYRAFAFMSGPTAVC